MYFSIRLTWAGAKEGPDVPDSEDNHADADIEGGAGGNVHAVANLFQARNLESRDNIKQIWLHWV